jgi:integrase
LNARVADISPVHLRNWLARHKRRLCNSTWNTYLRLLRALFDLAVEAKALTDNPAGRIEPQRRCTPVRHTPTWEQFQAIVASVRSQKYNARAHESADLIEFMGCCGLGQAESHGLPGERFDFARREITVFRQKTRKAFVIPMYPQAVPLLERLRTAGRIQTGQAVFRWRTPEVALCHACQRLGFPHFSPRSLRRMFILRGLERGIDPRVIAAWQGHVDGGTLVLRVYGAFIGAPHAQRMAALLV